MMDHARTFFIFSLGHVLTDMRSSPFALLDVSSKDNRISANGGLCLRGKPLFADAERLVFGYLTLQELGHVFLSSNILMRGVRRYFKQSHLVLRQAHFPVQLDGPNSLAARIGVHLVSTGALRQLHIDFFPLISSNFGGQRDFLLSWLARVLISSRHTLQSFRWMSSFGLTMALLQSLSLCKCLVDLDMTAIHLDRDTARDLGRCRGMHLGDLFCKKWLASERMTSLRSLTMRVVLPPDGHNARVAAADVAIDVGADDTHHDDAGGVGDDLGDDDANYANAVDQYAENVGDFGDSDDFGDVASNYYVPMTTFGIADILIRSKHQFCRTLRSLELWGIHLNTAVCVSPLSQLQKLILGISAPAQCLQMTYDTLSPVLGKLCNLTDVTINAPVLYNVHKRLLNWRTESMYESKDYIGWQLPSATALTLAATGTDGYASELVILPKICAPGLGLLFLCCSHARGVLEAALQAPKLHTLFWTATEDHCDVEPNQDRASAQAWRATLADFPWHSMLTCRLPIRLTVDFNVLEIISQRAPDLRKLTVPHIRRNYTFDLRKLENLVFSPNLRSLRVTGSSSLPRASGSVVTSPRSSSVSVSASMQSTSMAMSPVPDISAREAEAQAELEAVSETAAGAGAGAGAAACTDPLNVLPPVCSRLVRFSSTYAPATWFTHRRFPHLRNLALSGCAACHFAQQPNAWNSLVSACPVLDILHLYGDTANAGRDADGTKFIYRGIRGQIRLTSKCGIRKLYLRHFEPALEDFEVSLSNMPALRVLHLEGMSSSAFFSAISSAAMAGYLRQVKEIRLTISRLVPTQTSMITGSVSASGVPHF